MSLIRTTFARPHGRLASVIESTWSMVYDGWPAEPIFQCVAPDGKVHLVIKVFPTWFYPQEPTYMRIFAPWTEAFWFEVRAIHSTIGLTFRPGEAWRVLGVPASHIPPEGLKLHDCFGRAAEEIADLASAGDAPGTLRRLLRMIEARLREPDRQAPCLHHVLSSIHQAPGRLGMRELARSTGYSARHLRRLFEERIGLSPKTYSQLARLQQALSSPPAADYYDQSHLIRDFRRFLGVTPGEYFERARKMSALYNPDSTRARNFDS